MEEKDIRTALYNNLEKAVEAGSRLAIRNLAQTFHKYFPNPAAEMQDKNTFLRSLVNTFARGWDEIVPNSFQDSLIKNVFQGYGKKRLLLGSRLLLKKIEGEEINKLLAELLASQQSPIKLEQILFAINERLKVQGVSLFNVTLWDIIYQALRKKLKENSDNSINKLKITIISIQELSELFDEDGQPRQISGLTFLTNKKEIDSYLQQITPCLHKLGIVSSDSAIQIELIRIPLYDHSAIDPRTGKAISVDEYMSQIAAFELAYESSDLTYVHCYAGKQRSPMVVGSLAIRENIEVFVRVMEKILAEKAAKSVRLLLPTNSLLSSDEQTVLNHLFQTPYEIFRHIRSQRKQAKTLSAMPAQQRKLVYEFFFKCIEKLPDERYKNIVRKTIIAAFVAKDVEIIAKNLQGYLHDLSAMDISLAVNSPIVKLFLQQLTADVDKYQKVFECLGAKARDKFDALIRIQLNSQTQRF